MNALFFYPPAKSSPPFLGGGRPHRQIILGVEYHSRLSALDHQGTGDTYARHMKVAPGTQYRTQTSGSWWNPLAYTDRSVGTAGTGPSTRGIFYCYSFLIPSELLGVKLYWGGFGEAFLPGTTCTGWKTAYIRPVQLVPMYLPGLWPMSGDSDNGAGLSKAHMPRTPDWSDGDQNWRPPGLVCHCRCHRRLQRTVFSGLLE